MELDKTEVLRKMNDIKWCKENNNIILDCGEWLKKVEKEHFQEVGRQEACKTAKVKKVDAKPTFHITWRVGEAGGLGLRQRAEEIWPKEGEKIKRGRSPGSEELPLKNEAKTNNKQLSQANQ